VFGLKRFVNHFRTYKCQQPKRNPMVDRCYPVSDAYAERVSDYGHDELEETEMPRKAKDRMKRKFF